MERRNVSRNNRRYSEFQYGSAVRQLNNAVPKMVPDFPTYDEERELRKRRAVRKEIHRTNRINLLYTLMLSACITAAVFLCCQYINLQSTIKTNSDTVIELQDKLASLKAENNSFEAEINAGIDYEEIYRTAIEELGMVYPVKSQVVNYDSKVSEYVKQYKDIAD